MANNNGGPDNVTAVVVEFQGSRLSRYFRRSWVFKVRLR
jgi:serine/threonine protein phosphatase PrpC